MVRQPKRRLLQPSRSVGKQTGTVSSMQPPSACELRGSGQGQILPATRQWDAFLSSQGLRTWCSPSGSEGEHPSLAGNLGFPVRECSGHRWPSSLVATPFGVPLKRSPPVLSNGSLLSMPNCNDMQDVTAHGIHVVKPEGLTASTVVSLGLSGSRGHVREAHGQTRKKPGLSQRQVTTATPGRLDFRRTGIL